MMGRTHALGGVATLWLLRFVPGTLVLGLASGTVSVGLLAVVAAFGALLPDLDASASLLSTLALRIGEESRRGRQSTGHVWEFTPFALPSQLIHRTFGHRGVLHSLVGLFAVVVISLVLLIAGYIDWRVAIVLLFGYASHLALDACTPHGIPLFWPRRSRVHLLPPKLQISTGSSMEELVLCSPRRSRSGTPDRLDQDLGLMSAPQVYRGRLFNCLLINSQGSHSSVQRRLHVRTLFAMLRTGPRAARLADLGHAWPARTPADMSNL